MIVVLFVHLIMPNPKKSVDISVNTMFDNESFNNNVDNKFNFNWCNALKRNEQVTALGFELVQTTMKTSQSAMKQVLRASVGRPLTQSGDRV